MAIPVNPLEIGALAAAAGARVGNLGLQPYGVDVSGLYKPMFAMRMQELQQQPQYAQMANQKAIAQLQAQNQLQNTALSGQNQLAYGKLLGENQQQLQQGSQLFQGQQNAAERAIMAQKLALEAQQQQGQLGLGYAQLGQQAQQSQGNLGLGYAQLSEQAKRTAAENDLRQKQAQVEALKAQMMMSNRSNNMQAALGATYLKGIAEISPNDPKYSEKVMKLQNGILDFASKQEGIDAADIEKLRGMSPEEFKQAAYYKTVLASMAGEGKNNPGALMSMFGTPGVSFTQNPDGSISYTSIPGKGGIEKTQEALQGNQNISRQAQGLSSLIAEDKQAIAQGKPSMFSTMGNLAANAGTTYGRNPIVQNAVQWAQNVPGLNKLIPGALDPQVASELDDRTSRYETAATNFKADWAKNVSPFLLRNADVMNSIAPNPKKDDPSTAAIKAATIDYLIQQKAALDSEYLSRGITLTKPPEEYKQQLQNIVDTASAHYNEARPLAYNYQAADGTPVDLEATIRATQAKYPNVSRDEIIAKLKRAS